MDFWANAKRNFFLNPCLSHKNTCSMVNETKALGIVVIENNFYLRQHWGIRQNKIQKFVK